MTDALLKRLTASATGAFDLDRSHYRKDCADALAEIERLRAALKAVQDWLDTLPNAAGIPGFPKDQVDAAIHQQSTLTEK